MSEVELWSCSDKSGKSSLQVELQSPECVYVCVCACVCVGVGGILTQESECKMIRLTQEKKVECREGWGAGLWLCRKLGIGMHLHNTSP